MEETVLSTPEPRGAEYNRKPQFISHLIAGLIDIFLIFLATFGIYQIELNSPISSELTSTKVEMNEISRDYMLTYDVGEKIYEFSEQQRGQTPVFSDEGGEYIVLPKEGATREALTEATKARDADERYKDLAFNFKFITYGLMMIAGGSSAFVFVFLIPLLNRKRYTIGRAAGGVVLISRKRQDKVSPWVLLGRFFWVLLIDMALPYLWLSEIFILMIVAAGRLIVRGIDRENNRCVIDLLTGSMGVSSKTYRPINEQ